MISAGHNFLLQGRPLVLGPTQQQRALSPNRTATVFPSIGRGSVSQAPTTFSLDDPSQTGLEQLTQTGVVFPTTLHGDLDDVGEILRQRLGGVQTKIDPFPNDLTDVSVTVNVWGGMESAPPPVAQGHYDSEAMLCAPGPTDTDDLPATTDTEPADDSLTFLTPEERREILRELGLLSQLFTSAREIATRIEEITGRLLARVQRNSEATSPQPLATEERRGLVEAAEAGLQAGERIGLLAQTAKENGIRAIQGIYPTTVQYEMSDGSPLSQEDMSRLGFVAYVVIEERRVVIASGKTAEEALDTAYATLDIPMPPSNEDRKSLIIGGLKTLAEQRGSMVVDVATGLSAFFGPDEEDRLARHVEESREEILVIYYYYNGDALTEENFDLGQLLDNAHVTDRSGLDAVSTLISLLSD